MNWEILGAAGEAISAVAVVVTLLYLSRQVRTSNRFAAANHLDVHMDRVRAFELEIARDGEMARIWDLGNRQEFLTDEERVRFRAMAKHQILIQRDGWIRSKLIGELPGLWPRERVLDVLVHLLTIRPGQREYWETEFKNAQIGGLDEEFFEYVNSRLVEESAGSARPDDGADA